jgi:hypothetical protein
MLGNPRHPTPTSESGAIQGNSSFIFPPRLFLLCDAIQYFIMINRWIPWKFLIKRAARAYGILDPLTFLARIRQFSQPSEVQEPIELVRAGIAFHTRGLINTKAIQHNLDWIWPYWVERQFNPNDNSFIPRAFSFSHVNLTHRNWTAVGHPELQLYPIIDPRGLITPLYDGWSLDLWIISNSGEKLLPSKLEEVDQEWILSPNLAVRTSCSSQEMALTVHAYLDIEDELPLLEIDAVASCPDGGWLAMALRPYNPEGIQFIETVASTKSHSGWLVNESTRVGFSRNPEKMFFSNYHEGDVIHKLQSQENRTQVSCEVGMATAAALFALPPGEMKTVRATVPLEEDLTEHHFFSTKRIHPRPVNDSWEKTISSTANLRVPDKRIQFLYDAAIRTLVLLSAEDIVPGPYTYRRFWFRDACLMLHALMAVNLTDRTFSLLDTFPGRQKLSGYFQSQEGEWDSNGEVLWIMDRFQQVTGHTFEQSWINAVTKGADWILRKRMRKVTDVPHAGLLPPGFSAEHLGPNDYYYWDDFWSLAGLRSAARLAGLFISGEMRQKYEKEAFEFEKCIRDSIESIPLHRSRGGIPASPYRRMDAGAIGSMVADYPLQLYPKKDERIACTTEFLMENCFHKGAFFQDMIHSGTNIYLTLDIAQTLLRNGDDRYRQLLHTVADLATSTGQWPEAIHPLTHGGCMGDGQHGWAAAEWVMMIRNLFVREEGDSLVIGSGILPQWITSGESLHFGPTQTLFGRMEVDFHKNADASILEVSSDFSGAAAKPTYIIVDVPGYQKITATDIGRRQYILQERV